MSAAAGHRRDGPARRFAGWPLALALALLAPLACRAFAGKNGAEPPGPPGASAPVTWTCTGNPCPWGATMNGNAIVWSAATGAAHSRLGYTASAAIYLPADDANGMTISVSAGSATVYAGPLNVPTHRMIATLPVSGSTAPLRVTDVAPGEVLSVLGSGPFTYAMTPPPPGPTLATDVPAGQVIQSVSAHWVCATSRCTGKPWPGAVIAWPIWAAEQGNGRDAEQGRLVFDAGNGRSLYAYMGKWANGCRITARSGRVEVVEWRRGSETWRRTFLNPGETHVVQLRPPENGALIEAPEGVPAFSVALESCTPPRSAAPPAAAAPAATAPAAAAPAAAAPAAAAPAAAAPATP